jgi:hypothetical protein
MRKSLVGLVFVGCLLCPAANADEITLLVPADAEWLDTGVTIGPDQKATITAAGVWASNGWEYVSAKGYDGTVREAAFLPSAAFASLIGRVGAKMFPIGISAEVAREGRLFVAMNDVPRTYADNTGYLAVRVQLQACDETCRKPARIVR